MGHKKKWVVPAPIPVQKTKQIKVEAIPPEKEKPPPPPNKWKLAGIAFLGALPAMFILYCIWPCGVCKVAKSTVGHFFKPVDGDVCATVCTPDAGPRATPQPPTLAQQQYQQIVVNPPRRGGSRPEPSATPKCAKCCKWYRPWRCV
jgi:hypothetical protein